MIQYIIQTIAFQVLFLLIYDLFLKKETFFNWNRIYLIGTAILSIVLPSIKIESFKEVVPQEYMISLPAIILGKIAPNTNSASLNSVLTESNFSIWEIAFYLGLVLTTCLFLYKFINVISLIIRNQKSHFEKLIVVKLKDSKASFSFFRYVFLGELLEHKERETILKHENIHAKQLHSIDLLFFEALRVFFWFNPLIYIYQKRIATLHEFIADSGAVKEEGKLQYYQSLLSQVFETKHISFINPFFKQSLIKKRIVMLQKSESKQIKLLKYALLVPMILGMLVYTSCGNQKKLTEKRESSLVEQINQLKYTIESKEEIKSEEEKQAMISLSKTLNKTKYKNAKDVPFSVVDQVPIFPGCEDVDKSEQKSCLSLNLSKHINENFNTKIADSFGLKGKQRINVIFKINKEGNVVDARSRGPHANLEAEAIRVIYTIPKLIPGKHKGKAVNVPYSLPIVFQVAD